MVTDHVLTLIDVLLAVEATVAGGTGTRVAVDLVLTLALVAAGDPLTVINVHLAVFTLEASPAETLIAGHIVDTDSSVLTGAGFTLIYKLNVEDFSH